MIFQVAVLRGTLQYFCQSMHYLDVTFDLYLNCQFNIYVEEGQIKQVSSIKGQLWLSLQFIFHFACLSYIYFILMKMLFYIAVIKQMFIDTLHTARIQNYMSGIIFFFNHRRKVKYVSVSKHNSSENTCFSYSME